VILFDRDGDGGAKRHRLEHCLKKKKKNCIRSFSCMYVTSEG